ncbi:MAG: hypothetical protein IPN14_13640 [Bacteroidetes bacterium]|nr:hypothetical protein [Bacteroidota bacterium]
MNKFNTLILSTICTVFISSCTLFKSVSTQQNAKPYEKEDGVLEAMALEKEKTLDPATQTVPAERLLAAYNYANTLRNDHKKTRGPVSDITWTERGPNNVGGRTRALLYDKNDVTLKTVWAGSVGGGLWKCTDITLTPPSWVKINDLFDNLAITSIAQHPTNHDTMYFSTGEGFGNFDAIRGLGVWRTTDGGTTWSQLASTNNSSFYYCQKIVVANNGTLYVATRNGLHKSTDHGNTFTKVIGNGVSGGTNDYTTDVELGSDGDIYVGFGNQVFKSDNAVHGVNKGNIGTWTNISPAGTYYRTELFNAPSDSSRIYALCHLGGGTSPGIFRSVNGGTSWTGVTSAGFCDRGTFDPDFTRNQAWYDLIGGVDPNVPATIYIGGVDALKSTDGGDTWTQITSWTGGATGTCTAPSVFVHADHHAIVFKPGSSSEILWGTDGGIFRTTNSGTSFAVKNTGYNVTQYYGCAAHPTLPNYFLAGAQDNGTQKFTAAGINATTQASGGDGAFCHIDQTNGNIQLTSYVYNNYYVSNNGGGGFGSIGGGTNGTGRFINPTDYDDVNDIQYGGHNNGLYELLSGVGVTNTRSTRNISAVVGTRRVSAVTVDPNTPSTVWMAFQEGSSATLFVKVENASNATPTVTNLSSGLPTSNGIYLSSISVEKGNSNHILISYSNYGTNSVWESLNGGTSWTSVEGNLPDMPVRWAMIHPDSSDMAFLATDLGVWSTNNLNGGSTDWAPTNNGFANVRVDMLQFRYTDNTIAAATHGRGLFTAVLPHVPKLNFDLSNITTKETPTTTIGCKRFKDYTVNAMSSYAPASPVVVNINVAGGATATELLDFAYTTNGSFTNPSHQIIFNNTTSIVPITIRIYDDQSSELVAETFSLQFDIVSGVAVLGVVPNCNVTINDDSDNPLLKRITFLTENFESGVNPPAGWTLIGTNSNRWGNKNFAGCGSTINNYTMQVYRLSLNTCGYNINSTSTCYVHRLVNASGYSNLQVKFDWVGEGEDGYDYAELVYSTNTVTPSWTVVPGSPQMGNSLTLVNSTVDLPLLLNNTTFLLGWRWVNDNNTGGVSVGFDNVVISGESARSIENTLTNDNEYLGPNADIYLYSSNGDIMARVQNLSNHDYGCTQVNIDRIGNSAQFITGETDVLKKVFDKTLLITPTNNNYSGNYGITLYVTNAEKTGFETQGRTWNTQGKLFKMPVAVNTASLTTPRTFATNLTKNTFLNGYFIRGEFNTGFSGFGVGDPGPADPTPLPVTLVSFSGKRQGNQSILKWLTNDEVNLKMYEVERSTDGMHFEKIGETPALGHTEQNYQFADQHLIENKYYYRLKIIDQDNSFEYSKIIVLLSDNTSEIAVYPNPIEEICTIYATTPTTLKLLNTVGKTLKVFTIDGTYPLDMKEYPAAMYYLLDTKNNKTYKIIKK